MNERPRPPMAAAPDAETPYAPACPQRGVVGRDAAETGNFFYAGRAIVHVAAAGRYSFVPAPQPVTTPPVSDD